MVNGGGFRVRQEDEPTGGTTTWLTYPNGSMNLDARLAIKTRLFTVINAG